MPDLKADEVVMQRHKRNFIQYGGARPINPVQFAGQDTQYMTMEGVSNPDSGGIDPQWVHDLTTPGRYRLTGRSIAPQDLPKGSLKVREKHGGIPRQLLKGCNFNFYEVTGRCADLSDFIGGWDDYVLIYSGAISTDKDLGTRTQFKGDDVIENGLSVILNSIYPIAPLSFGEQASTQVDREVIDVVYGNPKNCDFCDFGNQRVYALTAPSGAGSPGLPAEVVYTANAGASWAQSNIAGLGATEVVWAMDIVGRYLVVIGTDAHYWAEINPLTGVPGTFTKVSTGYVAAKSPRDLYVASPRAVYIVGLGGYIYKSIDITAGVTVLNAGVATTQNLGRIHGVDDTIVATGANGAIVRTLNRGATWQTTTTSPVATLTILAISVLDKDRYWIGTSFNGHVYYTLDGGESWNEYLFQHSGACAIEDIVFASQEVGYFSCTTTTPAARLFTTWNGGMDWTRAANRMAGTWPTFNRLNRIAVPATDDPGWASNSLAIGGLAGGNVDGVVYIGAASIF